MAGTEIEVSGGAAKTRYPDLLVLTEATRIEMQEDRRSIVLADMLAPTLVVEVISPRDVDSENYQRNNKEKRQEYVARQISEY